MWHRRRGGSRGLNRCNLAIRGCRCGVEFEKRRAPTRASARNLRSTRLLERKERDTAANRENPAPSAADRDRVAGWWAAHQRDLLAAARRRAGDAAAEDVLQEAFASALASEPPAEALRNERAWLMTLVRNKVVDHIRRESRRREVQDELAAAASGETPGFKDGIWNRPVDAWTADPRRVAESREFWQRFEQAVDALPERLRQAFLLREIDRLPTDEVCDALAVTPSNLWTLVHRARLRLREQLEDQFRSERQRKSR